jgi:hypothetical protein
MFNYAYINFRIMLLFDMKYNDTCFSFHYYNREQFKYKKSVEFKKSYFING